MIITICSSMTFAKQISKHAKILKKLGLEVNIPGNGEWDLDTYDEAGNTKEAIRRKMEYDFIKKHYDLIKESDGIFVLNLDKKGIKNYIGSNTFLEIGFAFINNRDIFLYNKIPDLSYKAEIASTSPIIINRNLSMIKKYYKSLKKAYVASYSDIKIKAVSNALRQFNMRLNVLGKRINSNIHNQPIGFKEIYKGALNRINNLKNKVNDYEFLVAIENGLIKLTNNKVFDIAFCIVENKIHKRAFSISSGINIPKDIWQRIIKEKIELGIYLKEKYLLENKDSYYFYSNFKIKREEILNQSVSLALSQVI